MKTLVVNMIAGRLDRLEALVEQVRADQIEAVFVLGNLVEIPEQPARSEATYRAALDLLGSLEAPIYLIPGEHDPSLATISRLIQAYRGPARVHLVHRAAAPWAATDVIAGFGGRLTREREPVQVSIQFPAWEARVAFEHLRAYHDRFRTAQRRILLFATLPQETHADRLDTTRPGVALLTSLISAYDPVLVCCGGPASSRGVETIRSTIVVNPGWLTEGSYALIDLQRLSVRLQRLVEPIALHNGFGSIVVALDGSPQAWRAFELAADLARRTAATLTLVYAWEQISLALGQPYSDDTVAERIAAGERILTVADRCVPDLTVEHEVLEGPAAAAIMRVAETHHADLIVMGARGRGGLRSVLGSVSHRVLHDAPCPVLIAREPPQHALLQDISDVLEEGRF